MALPEFDRLISRSGATARLPDGFQFSQGSLQDFVDCRRRFQLRYLIGLAWPALLAEPPLENEDFIQRGAFFHRLVHQHLSGMAAERLERLIRDDELAGWWDNYRRLDLAQLTGFERLVNLYPEASLSAPLDAYRLLGRFDLVAAGPDGHLAIMDWKTSRKRTPRAWLAERLQTRLYCYLLVRGGARFNNGQAVEPDKVQMIYWFAGFPEEPERFRYSAAQYRDDEEYLRGLVASIARLAENDFLLTERVERCAYCVYRSLCDRGAKAGPLEQTTGDWEGEAGEITLDFDQIAEIEF